VRSRSGYTSAYCPIGDGYGEQTPEPLVIPAQDFAGMIVPLRQPLEGDGKIAGDAHVPDL
jgi:hypothetical protein